MRFSSRLHSLLAMAALASGQACAPSGSPAGVASREAEIGLASGAPAAIQPNAVSPAKARKRLRVLATNDFHGNLLPTRPGFAEGREVGGAATLAAYFARERAATAAPTILLDGGDVMQGTPLSNLTAGRATVAFYNEVGFAAAALGNHEFDWGIETLRQRMAGARFAWLGANIYVKGSDTLPSWIEATTTLTLPGCTEGAPACDSVRVGIIGIATEQTPTTTRPSNVSSLDFGDEAEAIERWVPRLRQDGADFVIVAAHSGAICDRQDAARACAGEIVDVARRLRERPDLIVAGHTHAQVNTVVNGVRIVEANSNGTRFSVIDLERVSADSTAVRVVAQPTTYADAVTPEAAITALVAAYAAEVGPAVSEVIAHLPRPLIKDGYEYALGNLIADAQRAAGGTQVALMNNGGIRTELAGGPVRYSDLFRLQPFANTLVTMRLTGAQLRAVLEHGLGERGRPDLHVSGIAVSFDPEAPAGERIRSLRLDDGNEVRPEGAYSVTVNDFMAEGGGGYAVLVEGRDVVRTGIVDLDALIERLRAVPGPVPIPATGRFRALQ